MKVLTTGGVEFGENFVHIHTILCNTLQVEIRVQGYGLLFGHTLHQVFLNIRLLRFRTLKAYDCVEQQLYQA